MLKLELQNIGAEEADSSTLLLFLKAYLKIREIQANGGEKKKSCNKVFDLCLVKPGNIVSLQTCNSSPLLFL